MVKYLALMWRKFKRWRNKPKYPIYRKVGGYQAWKDSNPVRQDSWARIFALILTVIVLGVVPLCGLGFYSSYRVSQRTIQVTAESIVEVTSEATAEATANATQEVTLEVTQEIDPSMATATLTPMPIRGLRSTTPFPTVEAATATITPLPIRTRTDVNATTAMIQLWINGTVTAQPQAQMRTQIYVPPASGGGGSSPGGIIYFTPPPLATLPPPPDVIVATASLAPTNTLPTDVQITETPTVEFTEEPTSTPTETETATSTATPTVVMPVALFTYQLDPLDELTVQFVDQSVGAIEWNWDFESDGIIDTFEQNPLITFAPGLYTVALYAANTAGVSVYTLTLDLNSTPTPTMTPTETPTEGTL